MKYMGSKARISKQILPIILSGRSDNQAYIEPFVGGGNLIDKVSGVRIGSDSNEGVINALKFIRDNDTPKNNKEYTEDDYKKAVSKFRSGGEVSQIDSYALIAFSFGAKWCGGWSRGKNSSGNQRDYVAEQHRASEKQKPLLSGVSLITSSYDDLCIPDKSIIYCDPPYINTTGYKDAFNHDKFWEWCRYMSKIGHAIFISEYSAPDDFKCLWSQELNVTVSKDGKHKIAIEKLFTI